MAKRFPLAKPFIIKLPNECARNLGPKRWKQNGCYLAARERELNEKAAALDQTISDRLVAERSNLSKEIEAKLRSGLSTEIADLKRQADERSERLAQAQAIELELRTEKRNLEEREKARNLEMARSWTQSESGFSKKFQRGSKRNMRGK